MIDDTKMQDELLTKLSDTSTPDDALKITRKIEAQRQQKSAIQQEQKNLMLLKEEEGEIEVVMAKTEAEVEDKMDPGIDHSPMMDADTVVNVTLQNNALLGVKNAENVARRITSKINADLTGHRAMTLIRS